MNSFVTVSTQVMVSLAIQEQKVDLISLFTKLNQKADVRKWHSCAGAFWSSLCRESKT